MKMISSSCALVLCIMVVNGLQFLGTDKPAQGGEGTAEGSDQPSDAGDNQNQQNNDDQDKDQENGDSQHQGDDNGKNDHDHDNDDTDHDKEQDHDDQDNHDEDHENDEHDDEPPSLDGPAHTDNFQDELLDQADPEFDMVSGGDGCVSWDDMQKLLQDQFQEGAPDLEDLSEAEKKEMDEVKGQMEENMKMMCEHADTNHDSCIDEPEFKAAGELEGYPPGFQEKKQEHMSEDAFTEEMLKEDRMEFDAMDRSGDGKVSRSESYHYASENMDGADLSDEDLNDMFDESDTDGDGFISWEEFEGAGAQIDGDGNEMEGAVPMSFKVMMHKRKYEAVLANVTKQMLSNSVPLEVTAKMLNIDAHTIGSR